MNISDAGLQLIKDFEGFRSEPYLCPAGVPTIGYGATYYPDGTKVTLRDDPISEEDASDMLRSQLRRYEAGVSRYVSRELQQNEFDALVSFAYNVGLEALRRSTLLALLNLGDFEGASAQFMRWNRGGGRVLPGLTRRRAAERDMFDGVVS